MSAPRSAGSACPAHSKMSPSLRPAEAGPDPCPGRDPRSGSGPVFLRESSAQEDICEDELRRWRSAAGARPRASPLRPVRRQTDKETMPHDHTFPSKPRSPVPRDPRLRPSPRPWTMAHTRSERSRESAPQRPAQGTLKRKQKRATRKGRPKRYRKKTGKERT